MPSKYKVTFLLDKTNLWFEKQLMNYDFKLSKKYYFKFSKNPKEIKNQHIVFPLSYTKILPIHRHPPRFHDSLPSGTRQR